MALSLGIHTGRGVYVLDHYINVDKVNTDTHFSVTVYNREGDICLQKDITELYAVEVLPEVFLSAGVGDVNVNLARMAITAPRSIKIDRYKSGHRNGCE